MNDCNTTAEPIDRVACILSYNGNVLDTFLNYTLLLAHVAVEPRMSTASSSRSTNSTTLFCFFFVICFQIILCFFLGCAGISIVWCACLGWQCLRLPTWLGIMDAVLLLYYAISMEWITTVAHVCAILLGRGLYLLSQYLQIEDVIIRQQQRSHRPIPTN